MDEQLKRMFSPASIAVVGASNEPGKMGNVLMANLKKAGFAGELIPINPKESQILGHQVYPSLAEAPPGIDLAVVAVAARFVPQVLEEGVKNGIAGAVIISAGFGETGSAEGQALEQECLRIARAGPLRLIGPNCLGIIRTPNKVNATFASQMPLEGKIAFVSQSGAFCTSILDWANAHHFGFSTFVSLGNMADVKFTDIILFLGEDKDTEGILLYIEGLREGREFVEGARQVTGKKPILCLKTGRTELSSQAAKSHTGALAGSDEVYTAAFRRAGIVRVDWIDELFDCAHALAYQPAPLGEKVLVITNAGGMGIAAADACAYEGLRLATLSPQTIDKLGKVLPPNWSLGNPVDIIGDATPQRYRDAIVACLDDEGYDGIVIVLTPQAMTDPEGVAREVSQLLEGYHKPVLAAWMGEETVQAGRRILNEHSIPTVFSPGKAVRIFRRLREYSKNLALIDVRETSKTEAERIIAKALAEQRTMLSEEEAKQVLKIYGIPVNKTATAQSEEEALQLAEYMGFPVAMKVLSPDISHKSDVGGVRLNLSSPSQVQQAFSEMMDAIRYRMPEARVLGVTIGEMVQGDREVFVGMNRDPQFGPVLLFGLGGIFIETIKDISYELAPVNHSRARDMIERVKTFPILAGIRGKPPANIDALADILVRVSRLAEDLERVKSLDINPIILEGFRAVAVDARIELAG